MRFWISRFDLYFGKVPLGTTWKVQGISFFSTVVFGKSKSSRYFCYCKEIEYEKLKFQDNQNWWGSPSAISRIPRARIGWNFEISKYPNMISYPYKILTPPGLIGIARKLRGDCNVETSRISEVGLLSLGSPHSTTYFRNYQGIK